MNCKEAAYFMAKKEERKASIGDRINFFFHLIHCGPCRRFLQQLNRITEGLRNWKSKDSLSEVQKTSLRKKISENQ